MVPLISVELIEATIFTSRIIEYVDDDRYRAFQSYLVSNPELGVLVPNSGGLRKARMAIAGAGKSGGARVIYLYLKNANIIFLLLVYLKSSRENLTQNQLKQLREISARIKTTYRNEET